jgi:O-antigen ligase
LSKVGFLNEMTSLLALASIPWVFVLFHQISHRGLSVFLLWLLIAPVATNLLTGSRGGGNPFFRSAVDDSEPRKKGRAGDGYLVATDPSPVRLNQLLEPSRTLLLCFFAVILLNILVRKGRLEFDSTEVWMGLFSTILLASVIFKSYRFDFSMRVASDAFLVAFASYFVSRRYVKTDEQLSRLIQVISYVGLMIIVICLVERLMHGGVTYRLAGPFRNPGIVSTVVTVAFFLALLDSLHSAGLLEGRQVLPGVVRRSVLCLAPLIVLLTWARSNYVGFLAGVWAFVFLGRKYMGRSRRIGMVGLTAIMVLLVSLSASVVLDTKMLSRLGDSGTVYGRLATWKVALTEGSENLVFGIGLNNIRNVLAEKSAEVGDVHSWVRVHNSFLQIYAEQGLTGLTTYFGIVLSIIGTGLRLYRTGIHVRDRWRGIAVVAMAVAYLMPSFYASLLHEPNPMQTIFVYSFFGGIAGVYGANRRVSTSRVVRLRPALSGRPLA